MKCKNCGKGIRFSMSNLNVDWYHKDCLDIYNKYKKELIE